MNLPYYEFFCGSCLRKAVMLHALRRKMPLTPPRSVDTEYIYEAGTVNLLGSV